MQALHEKRTKVNGKFLAHQSGKPVTILGQFLKFNSTHSSFEMKSTDNQVINVVLNEPINEPIDGWIEVRGTAQGKTNVLCSHYIVLPKQMSAKFSPEVFNDIVNVINMCDNPWVVSDKN